MTAPTATRRVNRDLWVDFNDADKNGLVATHVKHATPGSSIEVGATVLCADDEGTTLSGRVVNVTDTGLVLVALDV